MDLITVAMYAPLENLEEQVRDIITEKEIYVAAKNRHWLDGT